MAWKSQETGQDIDCGFSVSGDHCSIFPVTLPLLHSFLITWPQKPCLLSQDGSWQPVGHVGFPSKASSDFTKVSSLAFPFASPHFPLSEPL